MASELFGDSRLLNGHWTMEQGGWFVPSANGAIALRRVGHGIKDGIDPGPVPAANLGFIHTHPNGPPYLQGFSPQDRQWSNVNNVTIFAVSHDSIFSHAPFHPDRACARR